MYASQFVYSLSEWKLNQTDNDLFLWMWDTEFQFTSSFFQHEPGLEYIFEDNMK